MVIIYLFWILFSIIVGLAGRHRALGFWGFFLASLFLSPILMLLVLLVTQPRTEYQPRIERPRRTSENDNDPPENSVS